ncbi:alpha/beta hydrolase [Candidatus Saccharibacteria bacterium]|nr:alpha/beta hydrolase [Candidatus Saccharibacteria bacterium]
MSGKLNKTVVDGLLTEYLELGRGPVLLLLHGWGQSAAGLLPLATPLAKSYKVIVPSLPGFGGSSEPKQAWGTEEYAEFVEKFVEKTGVEPVAVMGHSFGGRVMVRMFAGKKIVEKLVFIDSAGVRRAKTLRGVLVGVLKWPFKVLPQGSGLRKWAVTRFGSRDYRNATPMMREVLKRTVAEDLSKMIPEITARTLIIWGEKDEETPLKDTKIWRKIPKSRLEVVAGAGHFPFVDNPVEVYTLVERFLRT